MLVITYMAVELFIGIVMGIALKSFAKAKAEQAEETKVIPANDYTSPHFGKKFPRVSLDPLQLPTEFVIVQYADDAMLCERFYTCLGQSTKATYQDGKLKAYGSSELSSPLYLMTIFIPIFFGADPNYSPFVTKAGNPLLLSGLAWLPIMFWIPAFIKSVYEKTAHPE